MLAEGIHSVADTANQALLWLGIKRSERPADDTHPYGYGAERYVWALISAMGIFFLGCGVTVYHGVEQVLHPTKTEVSWIDWTVLGISVVVEGGVLLMAIKEANGKREGRSWREFIRTSSDPTLIAVLFEDSVAVGGVFIAAAGIGLSRLTGIPWFDGLASILIGLLLGVLALVLAMKNKTLLVGQSAAPEIENRIRQVLQASPAVGKLIKLRTKVMATGMHRVDVQVDFEAQSLVERLRDDILAAREQVKTDEGLLEFSREFGDKLIEELADEVDRIEAKIRDEVPTAQLIDVEGD
jgi:zinc transporter 9